MTITDYTLVNRTLKYFEGLSYDILDMKNDENGGSVACMLARKLSPGGALFIRIMFDGSYRRLP